MQSSRFLAVALAVLACCHSAEDEQVEIVAQVVRNLDGQLAQMDAKIAEIRSNDAQLAGLNERYRGEIADLKAKISAAANQPEIARIHADQLKVTEDAFARSQQYEARAAKALERAVEVRNAFLRDKQRQVTVAMDELGGARRKEWEPRVAQILARR